MEEAPYFEDVAEAPRGGRACWLTADDGVRIRVVFWGGEGLKGTLLLFPGRTEYAEKYGRTAADLAARGLATLAVDWRGQGLADRLHDDEMLGHVRRFADYQRDVHAMVEAAKALGAPEPYYLLGHSMGGCIGLRALHEGLDVKAAAFSAPMWGIYLAPAMRPTAWALASATSKLGIGGRLAPGTKRETYVLSEPFDDNMLTTDRGMWDYMVRQAEAHPELTLGGPSLHWLAEALRETRRLHIMSSPPHRAICFLGTRERIVDVPRIEARMRRWENGTLSMQDGAEHEVLMESAEMRAAILDEMTGFFFA